MSRFNDRSNTCWNGSCLIDGVSRDIVWGGYRKLLDRAGDIPREDWEKLLSLPDADVSCSVASSVLKKIGVEVSNNPKNWFEYLDYTCVPSTAKKDDPLVALKELNWLKDNMPESIRTLVLNLFAKTCLLVQLQLKDLFKEDSKYVQFINETNKLANATDKAAAKQLRKVLASL